MYANRARAPLSRRPGGWVAEQWAGLRLPCMSRVRVYLMTVVGGWGGGACSLGACACRMPTRHGAPRLLRSRIPHTCTYHTAAYTCCCSHMGAPGYRPVQRTARHRSGVLQVSRCRKGPPLSWLAKSQHNQAAHWPPASTGSCAPRCSTYVSHVARLCCTETTAPRQKLGQERARTWCGGGHISALALALPLYSSPAALFSLAASVCPQT